MSLLPHPLDAAMDGCACRRFASLFWGGNDERMRSCLNVSIRKTRAQSRRENALLCFRLIAFIILSGSALMLLI